MSSLSVTNSGAIADAVHQGLVHHKAGRLEAAEAIYRRVLEAQPDNPDALHYTGVIAYARGEHDRAAELIEQAIALNPSNPEYFCNIGEVYRAGGRIDDSVTACRTALELLPDYPEAHSNLAIALRLGEELAPAETHCRRALELKPDFPEALNNLGNILRELSRIDDARAVYKRCLAIKPDYAEGYRNLAGVKTFTPGDPDIAAMERILADPETSESNGTGLGFALGKAYDDIGSYDTAFAHLERANGLARKTVDFDKAHIEQVIARHAATFDQAMMASAEGHGCESDVPVFIVGMPRSGTTLVEQILASHPDVFGAGEMKDYSRIALGIPERIGSTLGYPECMREVDVGLWRVMGEEYLAGVRARAPGAARITDKMPSNFQFVGLIHMMLPNARIVHCMRDPLDTCLSCYRTQFVHGQEFTYDLDELGFYYRHYAQLMEHWRRVLPGKMLDLAYEDVVADVESSARRLIAFCGLDWDDACLDFHATERPIRTASAAQVRRPIYTSSMERWRRYERHLGPLIEALGSGAPRAASSVGGQAPSSP